MILGPFIAVNKFAFERFVLPEFPYLNSGTESRTPPLQGFFLSFVGSALSTLDLYHEDSPFLRRKDIDWAVRSSTSAAIPTFRS
jgi:hypothetical protein